MQGHCQHNLYICHCTPSSTDPSPIHPSTTTALVAANSNSSTNSSSASSHTDSTTATMPVYVTQTSVAVMTSPTLNANKTSSASMSSLLGAATDHGSTATTPLAAMTCNTIPRVIVNTNGRSATVCTATNDPTTASTGTLTVIKPRSNSSSNTLLRTPNLRASTMTMSSQHALSSPVDKYLDCFWPTTTAHTVSTGTADTGTGTGRRRRHHRHRVTMPGPGHGMLHSRTCLERIVFALLTLVLVIVFLVAALVFLYVGSTNLESAYSTMVFNGDHDRLNSYDRGGMSAPATSLNTEDGIDIVRIKTTEEQVRKSNSHRQTQTCII